MLSYRELASDGLLQCAETRLASEIARRFCDTCSREAEFRENYDAKTGAGQYDSGMTWSGADSLLLARALHEDSRLAESEHFSKYKPSRHSAG